MRDRSCSLRPAPASNAATLYSVAGVGSGGASSAVGGSLMGGSQHISLEAVNTMAKSVSTPHIPRAENGGGMSVPGGGGGSAGGRDEYLVNTFGKSP